MKKCASIWTLLAVGLTSIFACTAAAQSRAPRELVERARRDGRVRVLVRLRTEGVDYQPEGRLTRTAAERQRRAISRARNSVRAATALLDAEVKAEFDVVPYIAMEVDAEALQQVASLSDVTDVFEDEALPLALASSIPSIGADIAWATAEGLGQAVVILDTGVEANHSFFGGRVIAERCYSSTSTSYQSTTLCPNGQESMAGLGAASPVTCSGISGCDHGTHVAGIAAGSGNSFDGVARAADIIAVQVFSRFDSATYCGSGSCLLSYTSDQLSGLQFVYDSRNTYDIASVNLSLGGGRYTSTCPGASPAYTDLVDNLRSVGIATVIASGNNGFIDSTGFPGCIPGAVTVGATYDTNDVVGFSNSASWVDLLAPGVSINSSITGGRFGTMSGTSMATPHVTGAFALLKSANPTASVDEILGVLQSTGNLVTDGKSGITTPRIRVNLAVNDIVATPPPEFVSSQLPTGDVGVIYSAAPAVSGGTVPLSFTRISGSLPPGLAGPDSSTGVIAGVPTAAGRYSYRLRVTDADGRRDDAVFSHDIRPAVPTPSSPSGAIGDTMPVLSWTSSSALATYDVVVDNVTDGVNVLTVNDVVGTTYSVTSPLASGKNYQFRVRARVDTLVSSFSAPLDFDVDTVPPSVVSLDGHIAIGLDGFDLLPGTVVGSSGGTGTATPDRAADGDPSTIWSTPGRLPPQVEHITLDVGAPSSMTRVRLRAREDNGAFFPRDFEIQLSNDNQNFTTVRRLVNVTSGDGEWQSFDFPVHEARYVRLWVTRTNPHGNGYYFLQIAEIELLMGRPSRGSLEIVWAAPGDDGDVGKATSYDLRYQTGPNIDFDNATAVSGEPVPGESGSPQSFLLQGLADETLYSFALRSTDDVGNLSPLSNVLTIATLGEPPAAVTDLAAAPHSSESVLLTWTASGDDGATGTAATYDIRYAMAPITTPESFALATEIDGEPSPSAPGTLESMTVGGLTTPSTYYFALVVLDEVNNASPLSNFTSWSAPDSVPPGRVTDLIASPPHAFDYVQATASVVSSSSSDGNNVASRTVDGDGQTQWSTAGTTTPKVEHITLDVGSVVNLGRVRMQSRADNGAYFPRDFELQVSVDNVSFTTVRTITNYFTGDGTWSEFDFTPASFRYLRLRVTGANRHPAGSYFVQIAEVEILEAVPVSGGVQLSWTAPGDNGMAGMASSYDIRYATSSIDNDADFLAAAEVSGEPTPSAPGTVETFFVSGLLPETMYYFALRSSDDVPNTSAVSNSPGFATAGAAPGVITDLVAVASSTETVALSWTATGDDGSSGIATEYDIRYATARIRDDADFEAADEVLGEPAPGAPGSPESMLVSGLVSDTTYYFAIKVRDDVGFESPLAVASSPVATLDGTAPGAVTDLAASTPAGLAYAVRSSSVAGSSGSDGANVPSRAIDGDGATQWSTPGRFSPQVEHITLDLGSAVNVGRIRMLSRADNGAFFPRDFEIQLSADNGSFTTVATVTSYFTGAGVWSELDFTPTSGRYLRLRVTGANRHPVGMYFVQLAEIEILEAVPVLGGAQLSWTAPGDSGAVGTATVYDMRYSTSSIDDVADFLAATPLTGEPVPGVSGTTETFVASGLLPETTYYFALTTADEAANRSPLSNVVTFTTQGTPPGAVSDLHASNPTGSTVALSWTATGGDGDIGTAAGYDVRYASTPILTDDDFAAATEVSGEPVPSSSGSAEAMIVDGLDGDTLYYFALKVTDGAGSVSELSNSASETTIDDVQPARISDLTAEPATGIVYVLMPASAVSASGEDGSNTRHKVVDGDSSTMWSTPGRATNRVEQITVDLGEAAPIGRVRLRSRADNGSFFPNTFDIQVSNDNVNFTNVLPVNNFSAGPGVWNLFDFAPVSGRFVRIRVTVANRHPNGYYFVQIAELEAYRADPVAGGAQLRWTATGDSGLAGTATSYDVRWASSLIVNESDFDGATPVSGEPAPSVAGAQESFVVEGLPSGTIYFAIKAIDELGNDSPVSNSPGLTIVP